MREAGGLRARADVVASGPALHEPLRRTRAPARSPRRIRYTEHLTAGAASWRPHYPAVEAMTLGIKADLEAAAQRVETWCGEPLLHEGEAAEAGARPWNRSAGGARRCPRRDGPRRHGAELRVAPRLLADPRPRPRAVRPAAPAGVGHDAAPPPGGRARRAAGRADQRRRARSRPRRTRRRTTSPPRTAMPPAENGNGNGGNGDEASPSCSAARIRPRPWSRTSSRRASTAPIPAPAAATASSIRPRPARRSPPPGFVEAARTTGVLILTHRRLLVDQFTRDLTKEGYGDRLHGAGAARRDGAADAAADDQHVLLVHQARRRASARTCTAWSSATRRTRRSATRPPPRSARFSEPVYIGMTATDQLLQKHVGDVFPAEVADFPLAEAVRRGVVAPLRCSRVRPIASLRSVEIVGGDFDQSQLAAALDLDPLNLAAADLYKSRFGDTPGIVYAAGVEHAERIAASMKAIGLKAGRRVGQDAAARSWPRRSPPTTAARSTCWSTRSCWPRAGTRRGPRSACTSRRRPAAASTSSGSAAIMRLHRRKEAGIVVDFAEPGAPHTERVITLHSLLGVDAYRPNGLVTPPPPRRRRWRRRPAKPIVKEGNWIVPVSDDPERRIAVIANQWRLVDASKLPLDEQRAWAVVAARAVSPADVQMLAERITGPAARGPRALLLHLLRREQAPPAAPAGARRPGVAGPDADHVRDGLPPGRGRPDVAAGSRPGCARAAAGDGRRADRGAGRPDRRVDVAAGPRRPRPRVPVRRQPRQGRAQPAGRARRGLRRGGPHRGRGQAGGRRDVVAARGRRCAAGGGLAAARDDGRAADRAGAPGALGRLAPAGRGARLEHPRADAARQADRSAPRPRRRSAATPSRSTAPWSARRRPAVSVRRNDGAVVVEVDTAGRRPPARRRRPGGDTAARRRREKLVWALSGDGDRRFATAPEVRSAAADQAPLEVQVAKLVSESRPERDGPGLGRGRRPGRAARTRGGGGAARRRRPQGARPAEDGRRARPRAGRVRAGGRRGPDGARLAARGRAQDRPGRAGRRVVRAPRPPPQVALARPPRAEGGGEQPAAAVEAQPEAS